MAPSETSIVNAALTLIGERRINNIGDSDKTATIARERFDDVRDDLLRMHPWNFATKRAELAAKVDAPLWGFDHQYTLPEDCLRVLDVDNPTDIPYRIEGRCIVTDIDSPLRLRYTRQVTNPLEMDVLFRQAFAAALGAELAEAITGDDDKVAAMLAIRNDKIAKARTPDAQEHRQEAEASEWLIAREEQGFVRRIPTGEGTPL